jgi:glycosyltransferase involved in cell wall biosynthesis
VKVAFFYFFPPTIWTPGGGETYLLKTREALLRLGVDVELFNIFSPRRDYDILHVFGSTYQLSDFVVTAKRLGMKVVVSPIAYTDKPTWAWKLLRQIDKLLPVPTVYTYRKRIYEAADVLLPSSKAMAAQLAANFGVPFKKMKIVYLGADPQFAEATPDLFVQQYGLKDFVLQVGRICKRKGQTRLIQALDGSGLNLVFIGQGDPDDLEGFNEFKRLAEARPWVHYLGPMSHDSPLLRSAFAAAKVHALPSIGEFPGLVNLEAAIAGANVVSGWSPEVYEYLGDDAFYCDPRSVDSIRKAVFAAYDSPRQENLRARILNRFTWDHTAKAVLAIYESILA